VSVYLGLKWLHIVSATILFGTGIGIAFFQWTAWRSGEVAVIARVTRLVVLADFVFTTPAVIIQLASGIALVHTLRLPWSSDWIVGALLLYALAGACWLPVVAIQLRLARLAATAQMCGEPLPPAFARTMRLWFWLGWPAFLAVLAILWLMVRKAVAW